MQWWNEFLTWLTSTEGRQVIVTAVVPFVAILVAGVLAALIARASSKRVLDQQDRELKASAIMAIIGAGRKATPWSSLGGEEKQRMDNQLNEADIRLRLLPVNGASAAADWAAHELAGMKKNSANFSFQAEQTFVDYRDRLLEWQNKPKRARKLFAFDLEQWRFDDEAADKAQAEKQQQWAAKQAADKAAAATPVTAAAIAAPASPSPASAPTSQGDVDRQLSPAVYTRPFSRNDTVVPITDDTVAKSDATENTVTAATAPEAAVADETATATAGNSTPVASSTPYESTHNDGEDVSTSATEIYAPPVNAGSVRQRTNPDPTLSEH